MEPPMIFVADWSEMPPVTVKYVNGNNKLNLKSVYTSIKSLSTHPGRGFSTTVDTPAKPSIEGRACSNEFLSHYWNHFASVIDYLADFAIHDSAVTQSVWFHLLDILQATASTLPHDFWNAGQPVCAHAAIFTMQYEQTLKLVNEVITKLKAPSPAMDKLIRPTFPLSENLVNCGAGWKAGLKPWQQFLYSKSPGFGVPKADREFLEDDGFEKYLEGKEITRQQHVPLGALGIIDKHTQRAREVVKQLVHDEAEDRDEDDILEDFDKHALKIGESFSYASLHGRKTYVQHMHPSPLSKATPVRYIGYADPGNLEANPELYMLDECVGEHKGKVPFVHPRGADDFHMWTVTTLREQAKNEDASAAPLGDLTEMFDDWKLKEGNAYIQQYGVPGRF